MVYDPLLMEYVFMTQPGGSSGGGGDASAANQVIGNASLSSIDGKLTAGIIAQPVAQVTAGPTSFTGTGSLSLALAGNTGVSMLVTYTGATANVRCLASYDGGVTYPITLPFQDALTGALLGRQAFTPTLETSTKLYTVSNLPGVTHVRFDVASYTVGTILVAMRATNAIRDPEFAIGNYLDTAASVTGGMQIGGYASQPTPGATFYPAQIAGSYPSSAAIGLVVRDVQSGTSVPGAALAADFKAVGAYNLDTSAMRNLEMRESAPGGTDKGLVVRNIPSGTQAVSIAAPVAVTGPLTDTQLRATPVPVSGPVTDAQLRATPVPVSGTVSASTVADVLAIEGDAGYAAGDLAKAISQTPDGRVRVEIAAKVSDARESYVDGAVRSLSLTSDGRLRTADSPALTEFDFFSASAGIPSAGLCDIGSSSPWSALNE